MIPYTDTINNRYRLFDTYVHQLRVLPYIQSKITFLTHSLQEALFSGASIKLLHRLQH